jgi:hypothetical protein
MATGNTSPGGTLLTGNLSCLIETQPGGGPEDAMSRLAMSDTFFFFVLFRCRLGFGSVSESPGVRRDDVFRFLPLVLFLDALADPSLSFLDPASLNISTQEVMSGIIGVLPLNRYIPGFS